MESKRTLRFLAILAVVLLLPASLRAQAAGKEPLDHDAYDIWKSIGDQVLAKNGQWLVYTVVPGDGDAVLLARNLRQGAEIAISRGTGPKLTADSRFLVFTIEPMQAVVDSLEKEGKRGDDLPKDSLGVLDLSQFRGSDRITDPAFFKVARVKSWQIPEEENAFLASHSWLTSWRSRKRPRTRLPRVRKRRRPHNGDRAGGEHEPEAHGVVAEEPTGRPRKTARSWCFGTWRPARNSPSPT